MRYSLFIKIVLCCICWQLFIASVFADEKNVLRVEAMGSASVSLTTTQLDNLVVDDAFRRAVAKAVEALVPREELDKISLMLEDKIYSNAARYILNYRVISKEMIADDIPLAEGGVPIYNVLIEADISMDLLTKDLIAAGVLSEAEVKDNLKKYKAEGILAVFKKPAPYFKKYVAYSEILELERYCKMYDISVNFQPSLARGLSYYNGSVFEVKTAGMKETIAGGGSYIINGIQSTGISLGIERLSQLAKIKLENERILIISIKQDKKAIQLAEKLRKLEKSVVIMDKISKALEYANSRGIPYAVFVGEEEVKKKK